MMIRHWKESVQSYFTGSDHYDMISHDDAGSRTAEGQADGDDGCTLLVPSILSSPLPPALPLQSKAPPVCNRVHLLGGNHCWRAGVGELRRVVHVGTRSAGRRLAWRTWLGFGGLVLQLSDSDMPMLSWLSCWPHSKRCRRRRDTASMIRVKLLEL